MEFKKLLSLTLFSVLLASSINSLNASLWNVLTMDQLKHPVNFVSQIQKEIDLYKKSIADNNQAVLEYKTEIEKYNANLAKLKSNPSTSTNESDREFASRQMSLTSQIIQTINDIIPIYSQINDYINEHISILEEYKDDSEFKNKDFRFPLKSVYSLSDLQKSNELLLTYESEVKKLEEQNKKADQDLENRQKTQQLTQEEYEKIKKEQKEFKSNTAEETDTLSVNQQGSLIDTQERLLFYKKILADLRLEELRRKSELINAHIKIAKLQTSIIKAEFDKIKSELNIDKKDIDNAENLVKKSKQETGPVLREYENKINAIELLSTTEINQINQLKTKYNLSDADFNLIKKWSYDAKTPDAWAAQVNIGKLADKLKYDFTINKDLLQAKIDQEKLKVSQAELELLIIVTWSKLANREFNHAPQEVLQKELKQYEKIKADLQSQISYIDDKKAQAGQALTDNTHITELIKDEITKIKEQKTAVFRSRLAEYNRYVTALKNEAFDIVAKHSETIAILIETYTNINSSRKLLIKKVDSILEELKSKSWIGIPPLWQGISHFVPDLKQFGRFLQEQKISTSLSNFSKTISNNFQSWLKNPATLILLILQAIITGLIFVILRLYLPDVQKLFETTNYRGIGHLIPNFLSVTISFLIKHLSMIYLWFLIFLAFKFNIIEDPFISIIFYLLSIIFWIYYAHKFINYTKQVNAEKGHLFVSPEYQKRFFTFSSILIYASIAILFFRQAFLMMPFSKSEVPMVLLAVNFMLLQICIIGIISRKQILSFIPKRQGFWHSFYDIIDRFYYLFLTLFLFVIVMSNPYIGYGPQFFYFISRILLVALLIPIFTLIHTQVKRLGSLIFFTTDKEGVTKERIIYGRTIYGLFVILSFIFLALLGIIIAANIWGYNIGIGHIAKLFKIELYTFEAPSNEYPYPLKKYPVNLLSIIFAFLYIAGGITISYLINKYVLEKMFDLLLVNIGVQNAILIFSRYLIILISIVIALKSIGQSSILFYLFAVITALGFAIKDIISDFLAYFIILIQRPVKIGDFVRVDETMGVVRHITPRSVIIRQKNSTSVVVPNSQIMQRPIINWNYTSTFFAFEDIILVVPYSSDPHLVKQLILKVLDNNINLLKNPASIVRLNNFVDNGFQFMIRGFLSPDKVSQQFDIVSDVRLELVLVLRQNGIKIASPTRTIFIQPNNTNNQEFLEQNYNSENNNLR